jgi:hypothetical protein
MVAKRNGFATLEPYKSRDGNELSPSSLPVRLLSNSTPLKIKVGKKYGFYFKVPI